MCQDDAAPGESRHGKKSLWQRIEEMDFQVAPQEHEVGITEYVDPSIPAIHGILKVRFRVYCTLHALTQ